MSPRQASGPVPTPAVPAAVEATGDVMHADVSALVARGGWGEGEGEGDDGP